LENFIIIIIIIIIISVGLGKLLVSKSFSNRV